MLWKLMLSLMALRGVRQGSQIEEHALQFENQPPSWYSHDESVPPLDSDESAVPEWSPTEWGPQTMEEAEITHNALHGDKWGGDMILPEDFNATDAGIRDERFRWPGFPGGAVIPFVIDPSLESIRPLILRGMEQYHRLTCIRFVPRTNQNDYIRIFLGNGCWSMIGRVGRRQDLSLGRGCHYVGLVVHELGHAVGLFHEHQRSDRDRYINVYLQNVINGKQHNFVLTNPGNELVYTQYDYSSIMHYGNFAFSRQPNQLPTMEAKNGQRLVEPYDKPGFTNSDVETIKKLYQC